jgi:hypothetical protein
MFQNGAYHTSFDVLSNRGSGSIPLASYLTPSMRERVFARNLVYLIFSFRKSQCPPKFIWRTSWIELFAVARWRYGPFTMKNH